MDATDDLAFLGYLQTSGIGRIFYQSAAGSLTALAATGQTVPSLANDTITGLDRPSLGSSTGIAFRAFLATSGQAVFKGSPATPASIVPVAVSNNTSAQIPTIPVGSKLWSIWAPFTNGLNHIAFRASMLDAGGAETRAILTDTGGTLRLIAKVGDTAPGLAAGDTFVNFDHPIIGDGDQTAFVASTSSGVVGLWRQAPGGGPLSLVMKVGDTIVINGTSETIAEMVIPGGTSDDRKYETHTMDNTGRILVHLTYTSGKTGIQLTLP